ncbi:MAG: hypothetical protein IJU38_07030 [Clostridia bacterium]|nr:hypothetical protein [Clostridia bacterium]
MKYLEWKKHAMLMAANIFWLPSGVAQTDVLAAYQFKDAENAANALIDLTGHGYNLKASASGATWNVSDGYRLAAGYGDTAGYLNNKSLNKQKILCAVIRYSNLSQNHRGYLITAGGASGKVHVFAATTAALMTYDDDSQLTAEIVNFGGPGFVSSPYSTYSQPGRISYSGSEAKKSGVIGVNFSGNEMYLDGVKATLSNSSSGRTTYTDVGVGGKQGNTFGTSHSDKSGLNNAMHAGRRIQAAVFFSVELTAAQHSEISDMMLAL